MQIATEIRVGFEIQTVPFFKYAASFLRHVLPKKIKQAEREMYQVIESKWMESKSGSFGCRVIVDNLIEGYCQFTILCRYFTASGDYHYQYCAIDDSIRCDINSAYIEACFLAKKLVWSYRHI
ncbi:hypothetical protein [Serratia microhaemolytica]|uniref:hypothetical protein n=1 Tax=Serratia microhaemolytica TaxID=2675110 RepID=UPI000FDE4C14|nr:hypothetical protein [Serratia microhaemolytica]